MAQPGGGTTQPQKLRPTEESWSALLAICGLVLVFGVLLWFAVSHNGTKAGGVEGALVSKIVTTSEPPTAGTKTTTTTEYGDTLVIFVLTIGTVLLLCAAFYGRLREIKVGGIDLTLAPSEEDAVDKAITTTVQASNATAKPAVISLAKTVAHQRATKTLRKQPDGLTADQLEQLGKQTANDFLALAQS